MNRKPAWGKLYLFAAVSCVVLFLLPPTNRMALMFWMVVMFGGVWAWLRGNQSQLIESPVYQYTVIPSPVAEFFDDDRVVLQQYGTEIPDDNVLNDPHEVI